MKVTIPLSIAKKTTKKKQRNSPCHTDWHDRDTRIAHIIPNINLHQFVNIQEHNPHKKYRCILVDIYIVQPIKLYSYKCIWELLIKNSYKKLCKNLISMTNFYCFI